MVAARLPDLVSQHAVDLVIANGENAINVLGQTSFTAATGATSQSRMKNPQGVSIDPLTHTLFVADTSNHRVTVYDVTVITNGENATGVLGQPTLRALVEAGHEVRGTARGEDKAQLVRSLGAAPVSVDLFDAAAVKAAVAGSEAVLHFATKIPSITRMRWKGAWRENDRLRTEGSRVLVDAALAVGAAVYIQESISFVYGDGGDE